MFIYYSTYSFPKAGGILSSIFYCGKKQARKVKPLGEDHTELVTVLGVHRWTGMLYREYTLLSPQEGSRAGASERG